MLWWDDVAKGLAKLNQQNDTPPATLSADGKAWFMHSVAIINYFNVKEKTTETWDSVTNSRIKLLHPKIRQKAVNFICRSSSRCLQ